MEFDLGRLKGSLSRIKEALSPAGTSPTPEFGDFIAQLHDGFPEDHPFYGILTGGYLNTEGTHKISSDGSESGWYEVHIKNRPAYFLYQVIKSSEGEFSVETAFEVDPGMNKSA